MGGWLDPLIGLIKSCRFRRIRGRAADRKAWRCWVWTFADWGSFSYQIWEVFVAAHFCNHRHFEFANSNPRRPVTWGPIINSNFGSLETQCCQQPSSPRIWNPRNPFCCCRTTYHPRERNCRKISPTIRSFQNSEEACILPYPLIKGVALFQRLLPFWY